MRTMVTVWVYTSALDDFLTGEDEGCLYPVEARYQTQLLVPRRELSLGDEAEGTCRMLKLEAQGGL